MLKVIDDLNLGTWEFLGKVKVKVCFSKASTLWQGQKSISKEERSTLKLQRKGNQSLKILYPGRWEPALFCHSANWEAAKAKSWYWCSNLYTKSPYKSFHWDSLFKRIILPKHCSRAQDKTNLFWHNLQRDVSSRWNKAMRWFTFLQPLLYLKRMSP